MQDVDNSDISINHLENIFTDETYYLAMKIVPLLERKVLYLSYMGNKTKTYAGKRIVPIPDFYVPIYCRTNVSSKFTGK